MKLEEMKEIVSFIDEMILCIEYPKIPPIKLLRLIKKLSKVSGNN